ncbi:hypothetical protein GAP32_078 [Cronobacter phage vB_CsaM_GAP32]|uniref:Uncharacterized protein n=1 Tax=Cronobacter phage vB_CsaM_GAP32 TaxID=1141136 RepID=K4F5P2_9CAUD|nr:hypothetical protein GAP32_078 [Cronobacter phage vB_CsaM_GAP32]AFC21526.1 hypothetical protein GAP32_078 [Cronobacter phage vB_CsaM_GAP32]
MAINARGISSMKVIVEANYIEDGTTVTKVKGTKEYTLRRSIKIYGENHREIKCDEDCVFLVDSTGNINMISQDTELVAHVHPEDLMYDIQDSLEENK